MESVLNPEYTGSIPVLKVEGNTIPEAWEKSLIKLYTFGTNFKTQYDKEGDPPSKDCTMIMVVRYPFDEPMIHRAFPGGLEDLEEYRQEVVDGIKDHWVRDPNDPDDKRWEYTYHERLTKYSYIQPVLPPPWCRYYFDHMDQLTKVVEQLSKCPYTRRAQAVTWKVWCDSDQHDPPCLQRLWFRIMETKDGDLVLNMNTYFRSRDAYDAAFMNMFAFVHLMKNIAERVSRVIGKEVKVGRYTDISDSYHIYGSRIQHFKDSFLKRHRDFTFEDRTWTTEFAQPIFDEAKPKIVEKIRKYDEER